MLFVACLVTGLLFGVGFDDPRWTLGGAVVGVVAQLVTAEVADRRRGGDPRDGW